MWPGAMEMPAASPAVRRRALSLVVDERMSATKVARIVARLFPIPDVEVVLLGIRGVMFVD
jgi:hypothetical protein